jgi:hypothetical protein
MEEITMSLRVAVPLFCLVVWIVILACSEGIMPTDASEAGFKSASTATPAGSPPVPSASPAADRTSRLRPRTPSPRPFRIIEFRAP